MIVLIICILIITILYSCLVAASKADKEMEYLMGEEYNKKAGDTI